MLKSKLKVFQGKGNVYYILWKHTMWFSKCLSLLTGWKEEKKKKKQSTKTFQRESNFLLFQFAYLYWEGLLIKPVASQHMLFNYDEQHDAVW